MKDFVYVADSALKDFVLHRWNFRYFFTDNLYDVFAQYILINILSFVKIFKCNGNSLFYHAHVILLLNPINYVFLSPAKSSHKYES